MRQSGKDDRTCNFVLRKDESWGFLNERHGTYHRRLHARPCRSAMTRIWSVAHVACGMPYAWIPTDDDLYICERWNGHMSGPGVRLFLVSYSSHLILTRLTRIILYTGLSNSNLFMARFLRNRETREGEAVPYPSYGPLRTP